MYMCPDPFYDHTHIPRQSGVWLFPFYDHTHIHRPSLVWLSCLSPPEPGFDGVSLHSCLQPVFPGGFCGGREDSLRSQHGILYVGGSGLRSAGRSQKVRQHEFFICNPHLCFMCIIISSHVNWSTNPILVLNSYPSTQRCETKLPAFIELYWRLQYCLIHW